MLKLYKTITGASEPFLKLLLKKRLRAGKEDGLRIKERKGKTPLDRPEGKLYWLHAASVGEAQSALILIHALLKNDKKVHILVTTGTKTSAEMMAKKLPERTTHQFYPLDHPKWVARFLDHWSPDFVFWMESELWPNMLGNIKARDIPAVLINARLSPRSFKRWQKFRSSITDILSTFTIILSQTEQEGEYYKALGAQNVYVTDNIKYSADALDYSEQDFGKIHARIKNRPTWLYASTHKGEETLACDIHAELKQRIPDLLTIIVPRHPERGREIVPLCEKFDLDTLTRGRSKRLPDADTDIYIADTLGELGLFYSLSPIAVIGRSFSDDGGGGHNPIEAAQLGCSVLHGPNVQNLQDIFDDMNQCGAAVKVEDKEQFIEELQKLFSDQSYLQNLQNKANDFAGAKTRVIDTVMDHLKPLLKDAA